MNLKKLVKRAPQMDSIKLKKQMEKVKDKYESTAKVHSTMVLATELGSSAILGLATKHFPTLGPIPVAPDIAALGVGLVFTALSKGKKKRAAEAVSKGAAHAAIGRMIHQDAIFKFQIGSDAGKASAPEASATSGADSTRFADAAGRAAEEGLRQVAHDILGTKPKKNRDPEPEEQPETDEAEEADEEETEEEPEPKRSRKAA